MKNKVSITITTNYNDINSQEKTFDKQYQLSDLSNLSKDAQAVVCQNKKTKSTLYCEVEISSTAKNKFEYLYLHIEDIKNSKTIKDICDHLQQILINSVQNDKINFKLLKQYKKQYPKMINDFDMNIWKSLIKSK